MGKKINFPLVGEYNKRSSPQYDTQDTVNMYVATDETGRKSMALQPLPGRELASEVESSSNGMRDKGEYVFGDYLYLVIGNTVYARTAGGTNLIIGYLSTNDRFISWENNTTQLAIVDGSYLYIYTPSTGVFQTVTDIQGIGFPTNPIMVYYQDGRFVICFEDSNQFFYSNQGNGANGGWDAENFFVMQSRPVTAKGVSGSNERLFLFGTFAVEVWQPPTYPNLLPFIRDNNFNYEFGLLASGSVCKGVDDTHKGQPVISFVYWLSSNRNGVGSFVLSTGGQPVKISSEAIDILLKSFTAPQECISFVYKENGHVFVQNNFRTDDTCLVVDLNTGMWFRRERINGSLYPVNAHAFFQGEHYVGDYLNPNLYIQSTTITNDAGESIMRKRVTQTFQMDTYVRIVGNQFSIDMQMGTVAQGVTPYVFLSVSTDGGISYGSPVAASMGQVGEYKWRAYWLGLGIGYQFTFKIECAEDLEVYFFGAMFEYEECRE